MLKGMRADNYQINEKYYLLGKEPMFDVFMLWNSVGLLKEEL